jgi:hypothetical protein
MPRWLCAGLGLITTALALGGNQVVRDATAQLQQAFPQVQLYTEGGRLAHIWGTAFSFGTSPELSAQDFVQTRSRVFGVAPDELLPGNAANGLYTLPLMYDAATDTYKFTLVQYRQYRDGVPVYNADLRLLVRNEDGYPLVLAASGLRDVGDWHATGKMPVPQEGAAHAAAAAFAPGLANFGASDVVLWAGTDDQQVSPQLALTFLAEGTSPNNEPLKYRLVCDAATGKVLHSENLIVFEDITGNVSGMATTGPKSDNCADEVLTPMKYATVSIDGGASVYADADGNFVLPNDGNAPVTVQAFKAGHYFEVEDMTSPIETLSLDVTPPGPVNFIHNEANSDIHVRAEVNGYVQANVVRDWVLVQNPAYPVIWARTGFPVRVNRSDGYCPGNAWFDGGAINFCNAAANYPNTAYSSVIYHEYGHNIVQCGGSGQGQYGEGMGDCVSVLILDDHVLGWGFFGNCDSGLRDAQNGWQYPCNGEVHDCGNLLSGCIWSTRNALAITEPANYLAILSSLVLNSVPLHVGDRITPQITIDLLTLDDDDSDIYNGTPHYDEINAGFSAHSMAAPPLDPLAFKFPNGRPDLVDPAGGTTVHVQVLPLSDEPQPGTGWVYYRLSSGTCIDLPMQETSPNEYDAVFPPTACGTVIDYFFCVQTTGGETICHPNGAPSLPAAAYEALSATGLTTAFADDLETDQGWSVGDDDDTAISGLWTRNVPQYTPAQPGADHTPDPGTKCWVTDYHAGANMGDGDVDGGQTTLKSPLVDLSGQVQARISYWRWYSNDRGSNPNTDTFRVDISNDGGNTWVNAETVGPAGPETSGGWLYHQFYVAEFVPLTSQMRVRFVAEDAGLASIVEAAVDDVQIDTVNCTLPFAIGDLNCDGTVDIGDVNPFVLALSNPAAYAETFPDCVINLADINQDGNIGLDDINPFVNLFSR